MSSPVFRSVLWVFAILILIWVVIYNFFWEQFKTALISETVVTLTSKESLNQIFTDALKSEKGLFGLKL